MSPSVSTTKVLYDVARRIGLDPDVNLSPDQAQEILGFLDDRLREGWELYDFLEITETEERAFRNDYDTTKCYPAGEYVWDPCTRQYYQAVNDGVGGPLSNAKIWTPYSKVSPAYIEWEQVNKTPIGAGFKAYTANPYEDSNAVEIPFIISRRGLEFDPRETGATVWLNFRLPYPGLGLYEWSVTQVYATGDSVLFGGDTYHSLVDNNVGLSPSVSPASWELFRIPYVLSRFIYQAAFSDTLIVNGQNEKAVAEEGKAYSRLSQEFDKQTLQQGQVQRFSVHVP